MVLVFLLMMQRTKKGTDATSADRSCGSVESVRRVMVESQPMWRERCERGRDDDTHSCVCLECV